MYQAYPVILNVQAVNYAFIAAPDFPRKDGTLQTDATCLGQWIVANKKLVPKCYELLRHGHLLFLRNTGVSIKVCYELHSSAYEIYMLACSGW